MLFSGCNGLIKYYNLCRWWKKSLNHIERETLCYKYNPMGGGDIIDGKILDAGMGVISFFDFLTGYLNNKSDKDLIEKIFHTADKNLNKASIIENHFYYATKCKFYYSLRMESDLYYEKAIECALNQIEISKKSARLFNQKFGPPLPVHQGFKRLVIQLEKDKDYQEAIDLCMRANKEEWNGDWEKRVIRLKKKLTN